MLSTVTCRSSMHSSSADCVLGEARLISSPTTMLAKTPPGRNSNSRVFWLKTETPVTSEGSRSGVNWIRRTEQSMLRARALLSIVLPTPGTSSMRRWPSASSTTRVDGTTSALPSMTFSMFVRTRPTTLASVSRSAPPAGAPAVGVSTSRPFHFLSATTVGRPGNLRGRALSPRHLPRSRSGLGSATACGRPQERSGCRRACSAGPDAAASSARERPVRTGGEKGRVVVICG